MRDTRTCGLPRQSKAGAQTSRRRPVTVCSCMPSSRDKMPPCQAFTLRWLHATPTCSAAPLAHISMEKDLPGGERAGRHERVGGLG